MQNIIALVFLVLGLFLIISMLYLDYTDNKREKENPQEIRYRNGAAGGIIILIGIVCLIIALVVKLLN